MKNILSILFLIIVGILVFWWAVSIMSDRICNKPYSPEFKATQQYKDMQCP